MHLGLRGEVVVYTAGFPTPALVNVLVRLSEAPLALRFRHWGDADVGGIRIWWYLRQRLGRCINFFRTTPEWIASESARGGKLLSPIERRALQHLGVELRSAEGPDINTAQEIIKTLLRQNIKLEQERF